MNASEVIGQIITVYDRFEIPPSLREHMFRVAAVADMICSNWENEGIVINRDEAVASCLVHDLGNIAKMKMQSDESINMLGKEAGNAAYWRQVRERAIRKYGGTSDEATANMAKEAGIDNRIIFIIENGGAGPLLLTDNIIRTRDWSLKILSYADCRVTPYGIASARERVGDLSRRYGDGHKDYFGNVAEVERQIFANTGIRPGEINDSAAIPYIKSYQEQ
ncbi:MAG TPA: HD domain-containing protein [Candidatus Baltobacteraceae bacterium]|nr:HD domain-containing protein [Candidatus Baltobacteraceae bacterium]